MAAPVQEADSGGYLHIDQGLHYYEISTAYRSKERN